VLTIHALSLLIAIPNPKPGVVPTLREWTGGEGEMPLTRKSRICIPKGAGQEVARVATVLQEDLQEIAHLKPAIVTGSGKPGDIVLSLGSMESKMYAEGYTLNVTQAATVTAANPKGLFYGTRSLLQMMVLSKRNALPRGAARDWPDYAERGFLLDVGRKFFPMSFLRNYAKFMGWYKMNDFQLHLNDNAIGVGKDAKGYAGFRLQSSQFPGLTSTDGSYSRKEIADLQDLATAHGVTITPEIDSPAHALALTQYKPELASPKYGRDHLDLSKQESIDFVKQIWGEFMPWFRADYVHIGADEYSSAPEAHAGYKKYINEVAAYIKAHGKKVRMWGGLKVGGGAEGVDRDIVVSLWYPGYHNPVDAVKEGYNLINTQDGYLYIVPFAGYYYQFLNSKYLYENWVPNQFGDEGKFPYQDPHILGGMFAVWNDKVGFPYTSEDVHELVLPAMPTLAEKLWSGPPTGKRSFEEFEKDYKVLGDGPGVNIAPPPVIQQLGNLAFHKPISASVRNDGLFGAATMVDGRPPTRWFADTKQKPVVTLDLQRPESISRMILKWVPREASTTYQIEGSADGQSWQKLYVTEQGAGSTETIRFAATSLRYIRLTIPEQKVKSCSLFEIEVYR